jgi:hypothetical protein
MTSTIRSALLVMMFFADVRVRAEEVLFAPHGLRAVNTERVEMRLAPHTLLETRSEKWIHIVRGELYVRVQKPVTFGTAFASFSCDKDCYAIFQRSQDEVTIKSLKGTWRVKRVGEKAVEYGVKAGLQVTLGEVRDDGVAMMEFPQSLPWLSTVKEWSYFYSGKPEEFKSEMRDFRKTWRRAVELVSELHVTAAGRTIASYEAELARERARRKAQAVEDAKLRQLFRQKTYIDP